MNYLNFFVVTLFLIGLIRFIEVILLDEGRKQGKVYARWTILILSINYGLMILSAISEYFIFQRKINLIISSIAIGIMIIRFLIKYWAFRSLGEYYSSDIEIRETHRLITAGPYRYLRHPVYLSNLLDFVAVPLFANSYYTILWAFPIQLFLIKIRMYLEEKELIKKFGEKYIEYKNKTRSLIPLLYGHERIN